MNNTHQSAVRLGIKDALGPPGLVLAITFFAFGALAKTLGAPLLAALGLTAFVFAIPGQVVLLDELGRDGSLIAAFIATTLTSIRLFPLTMSMLPVLRGPATTKATEFFIAHFIAVTVWVQSMLALPNIEREQRAA